MLDYVYGNDQAVAHFVAQLIPRCRDRGFGPNCKAIGVIEIDDKGIGTLIGGVVYHNWDPDSEVIEMSSAALPGKNWVTRETLRRIYTYPFDQVGCQMVIKRVMLDNERMLAIFARMGCTFYKVHRMFGRDHDGVLVTLTREAWRDNRIARRIMRHLDPPAIREAA
jgi:RimJ/RimL family protein N-acetyltransferase